MARKLALQLESLGQPFRQAAATASRLGYAGAALAARAAFTPSQLSATGRREVRFLLQSHRLELAAISAPLERGLDELPGLDKRIAYLRSTLELACDLGPRLVLLAAGALPADTSAPAYGLLREVIADLARSADRLGCRLALEAGAEPVERLVDFLATFNSGSLGITLDPATLLSRGQLPELAARTAAATLLHVHARDARPARIDQPNPETPLGGGAVDWVGFLGVLEEIGYRGWLTVKRGPTADPVGEAQRARSLLTSLGA